MDFSELDAQLASLGSVRSDILQVARKLAGDTGGLANVDQVLSGLASGVNVRAPSAGRVAPEPKAKPAPQLVSKPAAKSTRPAAPSPVEPPPAPQATTSAPSTPATPPPERSGPPHSEEIALPEPVQHHDASPRSGELSLDGPAPRSGSFALEPAPSEPNLDEDTDSDFEAEFAALSGGDSTKTKSTKPKSLKPAKKESVRPASIPPEPVRLVSDDDEETDAVLALFDAAEVAPEAAPVALDTKPTVAKASVSPIGGLSDELEPSMAPPAMGNRDPDAEFDALFDEASSPSSMPSTPAVDGDQDSVDDLLRDLGSPRVPQDLAARAAQAPSAHGEDELGEDPTNVFDMSAFDAVTGGQAATSQAPGAPDAEEDFEIEMDLDEVDDVKPQPKAAKPAVTPPRPPPQPPGVPGAVEKRPSFLGRLFGGPNKDPNDNK